MVNLIWFLLLLAGFAAAAWQGNIGLVTQAAFAGANKSVSLIISLAGVLMLWLGVLALLEQSGLLAKLGRFFAPLLHRLFSFCCRFGFLLPLLHRLFLFAADI